MHSSCMLPLLFASLCRSRWRGTGAVLVVAPLSGAHVLFCFSLLSSAALCPWTWARHCHRHLAHNNYRRNSLARPDARMPCYDPPRSVPLARASARQRWDVPHTFAHFHVCLRSGCDVAILYSWLTGGKRRFETDDFPRRDEKGQMRKSKHGA